MKKDRSGAFLTGAMLIVAISFVVENAYMFWSDRRLHDESRALQVNALPSVDQLSVARHDLGALGRCLGVRAAPLDTHRCVREARVRFADAFSVYRALPLYPGEEVLQREIDDHMAAIDRHVAALASGRPLADDAVASIYGSLAALDDALRQLVIINAAQAFGHTTRIEALRMRSELFEVLLGLFALTVAAAATVLGVRATRRHTRFLEERARELDLFAATVAHDLVGPLTSVGMAMPMIKDRHPDDEPTQRLAERALTGVGRVRALVEGLLAYARAGGGRTAGVTNLAHGVESVVHELGEYATSERVELVIDGVERVDVACAPAVLGSILANLVRNAIKHMGDVNPRRVHLRGRRCDGRVLVEVEDTGPGVPPDQHDAIFEPHVRLDPGRKPGLGLGLATVKRLVVAHGGVVGVRPAAQRGAIFWFELPRTDGSPAVARSA